MNDDERGNDEYVFKKGMEMILMASCMHSTDKTKKQRDHYRLICNVNWHEMFKDLNCASGRQTIRDVYDQMHRDIGGNDTEFADNFDAYYDDFIATLKHMGNIAYAGPTWFDAANTFKESTYPGLHEPLHRLTYVYNDLHSFLLKFFKNKAFQNPTPDCALNYMVMLNTGMQRKNLHNQPWLMDNHTFRIAVYPYDVKEHKNWELSDIKIGLINAINASDEADKSGTQEEYADMLWAVQAKLIRAIHVMQHTYNELLLSLPNVTIKKKGKPRNMFLAINSIKELTHWTNVLSSIRDICWNTEALLEANPGIRTRTLHRDIRAVIKNMPVHFM